MAEYGEPLTDRELDVLGCVANGATNHETALQLSISPNTVKVHIRNIYTKLGVSSRTEAMTVALQQGLLTMPGWTADNGPETGDRRPEIAEWTADGGPETGDRGPGTGDMRPEGVSSHSLPTEGQNAKSGRRNLWLAAGAGLVLVVVAIIVIFLLMQGDGLLAETPAGTTTVESTPTFIETPIPGSNWFISRDLPSPRANMASAAVGLNLYQIGGQTEDGVVNRVDVFRLDERTWSAGAQKLTPVTEAGAVVLAGEVYVLGGRTANGELSGVVEAYSPLNDGWRPVTSLPAPTAGGLALANDNFIYYFGGFDGDEVTANSYRYDPAAQTWETLPPLQQARAGSAGGVIMGKLYVAGGTDGEEALASCEVFDPADMTWSTCPDMEQPRTNAGAAVVLNKLYVLGGQTAGEERFSEVFDPEDEIWARVDTPMMADFPGWNGMGVASVETKIYALGGQDEETLLAGHYVYAPLVYQFFIPAASAGGEPDE